MKKKYLIFLTACLLVVGTSFGVTYAYLTATDQKVNVFKVGENKIEVEEEFEKPTELSPNQIIKKKPLVRNTGDIPCFVRVRVEFSDSDAAAFCEFMDGEKNVIALPEGENWVKGKDGYYYYTKVLHPGEPVTATEANYTGSGRKPGDATTPLFSKLHIKDGVSPELLIAFNVYVYAESREQKNPSDTYDMVWNLSTNTGGVTP